MMSTLIINSFILGSSGPTTPSEMVFGYFRGDFDRINGGTGDTWSAFDGDIDEPKAFCALSTEGSPVELGYDYSWANPSGLPIFSLDIWGSNDHGYINNGSPTDTKITLYGWNGSSWAALGDTGDFTDGLTANKKTITSSDTTTLFTKFKVILTFTGALTARIAEMKCFTTGAVQIKVPNIDGKNITPGIEANPIWGRSMDIVDGTLHNAETDCLASLGANTSDLVVPIDFDIARPVEKLVCYSSSDDGFFNGSNPTDMQIDLALFAGSWTGFGTTGTFTDANNLVKTITSSDTTTLFTKARIIISTASSQRKILSELKIHVFI